MTGRGADRGGATEDGSDRGDEAELVAYPDGPFLLRGDVRIVGPDGQELPRRRRTVALCRCGKSMLKPYCDGTHKIIGFRTEPEVPGVDPRDASAG